METQFTLKDLREQAGLSRAYVAGYMGVSVQALSNYESGIRRISLEQVLLLAQLYDYTAEDIIRAQLASIGVHDANKIIGGDFEDSA